MTVVEVDGIEFRFEDGWHVAKYDDWSYYRNQFGRMRNGIRAIDLIAHSPDDDLWLIEVKDYRHGSAAVPLVAELAETVWKKVYDTLAALIPAAANANDRNEKSLADRFRRSRKLRVVLHVEQPASSSRLYPGGAINLANMKMKLNELLRAIDSHPRVASSAKMNGLPWQVS